MIGSFIILKIYVAVFRKDCFYRADSALAIGAVNPLLTIPLSTTISADFIKNITSLLLNFVFCYRIKTVAYYRKTAVKLKPLLLG